MHKRSGLGIIGLATMGQNLALNASTEGYSVSVYNRSSAKTEDFIKSRAQNTDIRGISDLKEFVESLNRPRRIILMVKAGDPVDKVLDRLIPLLDRGDVIIEAGNSHYQDTDRRIRRVENHDLLYLGTGVSGGEYGALHGPSIMPGGHLEAYEQVEPVFEKIAARTDSGPCCTYLGPGSAGHYVKMVHNGIEYGAMEIIAEIYWLMAKGKDLEPEEMSAAFGRWNESMGSYLLEITADILTREDEKTGRPLLELILDKAKQKGTGKWSVQSALELGIPVPTITAGVESRLLSALKDSRMALNSSLTTPPGADFEVELDSLYRCLYIALVTSYIQGMSLLSAASAEQGYGLNLAEVARIWRGGCIIRSGLLLDLRETLTDGANPHLLWQKTPFKRRVETFGRDLRSVVAESASANLPVPALASALYYLDSLTSPRLPANMIQAQRDYFGAHTYHRVDREGTFHTEWQDIHNV
ncbi:MAG: NADP-dependent phosphogluconate dehydrogenase [Candidatus Acetothermia bacterium]